MQLGSINLKVEFLPPDKEEGRLHWVALCPEIDLGSQGDSFEEACVMIAEALQEWLRFCIEEGTLEDALKECGFSDYKIETFKASLPSNLSLAPAIFI